MGQVQRQLHEVDPTSRDSGARPVELLRGGAQEQVTLDALLVGAQLATDLSEADRLLADQTLEELTIITLKQQTKWKRHKQAQSQAQGAQAHAQTQAQEQAQAQGQAHAGTGIGTDTGTDTHHHRRRHSDRRRPKHR